MTCEGFGVLHLGQAWSCLGLSASCERRMPVREFDCLRLGTPMEVNLPAFYLTKRPEFTAFESPPAYSAGLYAVKGGNDSLIVPVARRPSQRSASVSNSCEV